ncbi:MAG: hypothetical protein R3A80_11035 [Bdellovibrionota bacterium]
MRYNYLTTLTLSLITSLFFVSCTKKTEDVAPPAMEESAETSSEASTPAALERIEFHTESVNGALHWMPESITVKAGQKYLLVAKHELEGGFDFHGLQIKDLGIQAQVNRNVEFSQEVEIPADQKEPIVVGCQFHPKHQSAQILIEQ